MKLFQSELEQLTEEAQMERKKVRYRFFIVSVQDLALQKYANHHQILKLFKTGRNVQSLNKIRSDEREGINGQVVFGFRT